MEIKKKKKKGIVFRDIHDKFKPNVIRNSTSVEQERKVKDENFDEMDMNENPENAIVTMNPKATHCAFIPRRSFVKDFPLSLKSHTNKSFKYLETQLSCKKMVQLPTTSGNKEHYLQKFVEENINEEIKKAKSLRENKTSVYDESEDHTLFIIKDTVPPSRMDGLPITQ